MNVEQLEKFNEQYDWIDQKSSYIFAKIEKLEQEFKASKYREKHYYDRFEFRVDIINIHGSYSYQNCAGMTDYTLTFNELVNGDEYLLAYEQRLREAQITRKEKEDERQLLLEEAEYKQFLKLQEKYSDRG